MDVRLIDYIKANVLIICDRAIRENVFLFSLCISFNFMVLEIWIM